MVATKRTKEKGCFSYLYKLWERLLPSEHSASQHEQFQFNRAEKPCPQKVTERAVIAGNIPGMGGHGEARWRTFPIQADPAAELPMDHRPATKPAKTITLVCVAVAQLVKRVHQLAEIGFQFRLAPLLVSGLI